MRRTWVSELLFEKEWRFANSGVVVVGEHGCRYRDSGEVFLGKWMGICNDDGENLKRVSETHNQRLMNRVSQCLGN